MSAHLVVEGNSVLSQNFAEDFFSSRPTDLRYECVKLESFHPVESLTGASQVTFILPRFLGPNCYLPHKMLLHVEVCLEQEGGAEIPNTKKIAPINNSFHSLFRSCRIWIWETLITKHGENYPFKSYMIDFLSMDSNAKFSWMRGQMWHQDVFGHSLENQTDTSINTGFKARMHRFKNEDQSAYVKDAIPLMGRLHCDLGSCENGLIPGLGMRVQLGFSSNEFVLQCPESDTSRYKLVIKNAVLLCPVGQLAPDMFKRIERTLKEKRAKMYLTRTEVTNKIIPGNTSLFVDQLFPGAQLPSKMILTLLPTQNYTGTIHTNPFYFARNFSATSIGLGGRGVIAAAAASVAEAAGVLQQSGSVFVEKVRVTLNGEHVDGLDISKGTLNEDLTNFMRLHYFMGFMTSRTGNTFTYEEFLSGFYFLFYDLSTSAEALDDYIVPSVRQGHLRLEMNFSSVLPHELTLLIYAEYPTVIEIDERRQLSMSY